MRCILACARFTETDLNGLLDAVHPDNQISAHRLSDPVDLAVVERTTERWLGEIVVMDWKPGNRSCGFRIALTADARNQGFGTEATRLIVDYVFEEIDDPPVNRIELEVCAFNPRAISVYERVGFRREGVLRQAQRWNGEYVDAILMSIVRSDRTNR